MGVRKPAIEDLLGTAHVVSLGLTTPFRGLTHREAVIFEGPSAPAEWSPFLEYDDGEAATWLSSALEQGWGEPGISRQLPTDIHVNGTIPAIPADLVAPLIEKAGSPRTIKVKVAGPGTTLAADIERVEAVRGALGPAGRIRLDANGAWNLDEAEHAVREMEHLDLEYIEQPVESLAEMAEIRRRLSRLGIQVAADESIRRFADLDQVIESDACDLVVLKVQPLGGLGATLSLMSTARQAGLGVVISSALDTSVGLYQAGLIQAHLEATTEDWKDAGLGTMSFLAHDVVRAPHLAHGGLLTLAESVLDHGALESHQASPERTQWWHERLRRCFALLES